MCLVSIIHASIHKENHHIKLLIKNDGRLIFSVFDVVISVIEKENQVFEYGIYNSSLLTNNEIWNCKFSFVCIILVDKIYRIGKGKLVISSLNNFDLQYIYNTNIECDHDTFYFDNRNLTCLYGDKYNQLEILNIFKLINNLPNKIKHISFINNIELLINNVTKTFPEISHDLIRKNYNKQTFTMNIINITYKKYIFVTVEITNPVIIYNSISITENIIETTTRTTVRNTILPINETSISLINKTNTLSTIENRISSNTETNIITVSETNIETNNTKTFRDRINMLINISKTEPNYIYLLYLCIALIIIYIISNSLYLYKYDISDRVNLWYVVLEIRDRIKHLFINTCTDINDSSLNIHNDKNEEDTLIAINLKVDDESLIYNSLNYTFNTFKP